MRLRVFYFSILFPFILLAQDLASDIQRLKDEISAHGWQVAYVEMLADDIGSRLTGNPGAEKAEKTVAALLRQLGLTNIKLEPYRMNTRWTRGTCSVQMVTPYARNLTVASYTWAPSTLGNGVQGPVVDAGTGKAEDFAAVKSKMKGAIVLVSPAGVTLDDVVGNFYRGPGFVKDCAVAGALAVMFQSDKERTLLYTAPQSFNAELSSLPVISLAKEDVALLRRMLGAKKDLRLRANVKNSTGSAFLANNVVGEIRGTEKPDEVVVLGAHLDSNDLGPGALDNAAGCAALLETARAIKQLGLKPKRTIRFVFFTGEEEGMIGSTEYVKRHMSEMDNVVANLIMDIGAGKPFGWFSMGRKDLDGQIRKLMEPVANPDSVMIENASFAATDNAAFMAAGVPNLVMLQDDAPYFPVHHTAADTPDKIVPEDFKACVTTLAVVAYQIAAQDERFGRRMSGLEVEQMMKATNIEYQWRAANIWPLK